MSPNLRKVSWAAAQLFSLKAYNIIQMITQQTRSNEQYNQEERPFIYLHTKLKLRGQLRWNMSLKEDAENIHGLKKWSSLKRMLGIFICIDIDFVKIMYKFLFCYILLSLSLSLSLSGCRTLRNSILLSYNMESCLANAKPSAEFLGKVISDDISALHIVSCELCFCWSFGGLAMLYRYTEIRSVK